MNVLIDCLPIKRIIARFLCESNLRRVIVKTDWLLANVAVKRHKIYVWEASA